MAQPCRWCCAQDRPWTWGTLGGPLFRLALCDRSVSLLLKGTASCCGVHVVCCALCGVMSQDAGKRRKVALTLEVTHDGDDDDGLS